ncbi:hypothetical protein DFP94_101598 [Fontibacillus phaseoli]|uniref:Uncharacterized protein n=1 Tax=Fontibacillus phaseoli TaxID=1416533 RepID=A0A369BRC0_9BACL|nr:hypothetical protein [Fontibacillus phaseoli]RCX23007.1 hypothetical protein DFP94_101598 [Fontibacillus phaseoli]
MIIDSRKEASSKARYKILYRLLCLIIGISALSFTVGCGLKADETTLRRQASSPWWFFGPSVSDGVYSPAVRDDVYSKETLTHP